MHQLPATRARRNTPTDPDHDFTHRGARRASSGLASLKPRLECPLKDVGRRSLLHLKIRFEAFPELKGHKTCHTANDATTRSARTASPPGRRRRPGLRPWAAGGRAASLDSRGWTRSRSRRWGRTAYEWAIFKAVVEKMRSAVELIELSGNDLPSDEVVTGAGVLCADAGALLESIFDERLEERAKQDEERADG